MRKRQPHQETLRRFFASFPFQKYSLLLHWRSDSVFPSEIIEKTRLPRNTVFRVIRWGLEEGILKREGRKVFLAPFGRLPVKKPEEMGEYAATYEIACRKVDEYGQKLLELIESGKVDEWLKRTDFEPSFRERLEWLADLVKSAKTLEELHDLLKFDWFKDLLKTRIILEREYLRQDPQGFLEKMLSDRQRLKIREQMLKDEKTFAGFSKSDFGFAPPKEHILEPAPIDKAELSWKERQDKEVLKKLKKSGKTAFI